MLLKCGSRNREAGECLERVGGFSLHTFSMKARGNEKLTLAPPPFCAQMEGGAFRPLSGVFWSVAITEDFL